MTRRAVRGSESGQFISHAARSCRHPASEMLQDSHGPEVGVRLPQSIALVGLGEAQDIANAVLFLSSPMASCINGQVLSVDGGK
jgi:3-oxoacyl-[acyl-carrier protein] reductase